MHSLFTGSVSHPTAVLALGLDREVFIAITGIHEIPGVAVIRQLLSLRPGLKLRKVCVKGLYKIH